MKVLKYIFSMMLLGGIISACADLDTKLTNEWSESDTWRDADMAQGVLLSVYQDVMIAPDAWDGNFLDASTDNALTHIGGLPIAVNLNCHAARRAEMVL